MEDPKLPRGKIFAVSLQHLTCTKVAEWENLPQEEADRALWTHLSEFGPAYSFALFHCYLQTACYLPKSFLC